MNDQTVHAARVRGSAVAGPSVEGNVGPLTSQGKPMFENQTLLGVLLAEAFLQTHLTQKRNRAAHPCRLT